MIDLTTPLLGPVDTDARATCAPFFGGAYPDDAVLDFADSLIHWTGVFGLRTSIVAGQIAKETGHFRYGGQVQPWQYNFAGLGATNGGAMGATYGSVDQGVIAVCAHHMTYIWGDVAHWPDGLRQYAHLDQRYEAVISTGRQGTVRVLGDYRNAWWAYSPQYPVGSLDNGYAAGIAALANTFAKEASPVGVPYDRIHQSADDGPPRNLADVNWFVVHDTEGHFDGDEAVLTSPAAPVESAHFILGRVPGECVYSVPFDRTAWTAGNDELGVKAVQVEMSKAPDEVGYTDYQYAKLADIYRWCVSQGMVNVPPIYLGLHPKDADNGPLPDDPGIIGHAGVPDGNGGWGGSSHHTDPGPDFDWGRFIGLITGAPPSPPSPATGDLRYFAETKCSISGAYKGFWEQFSNDDKSLEIFGYPVTDLVKEPDFTVQYFQRAKMEDHGGGDIKLALVGSYAARIAGHSGPGIP